MSERLGLLFSDGSILVLPEGTDVDGARKEAEEHDRGEFYVRTRVMRLEIEIGEIL